MSLTSPSKPSDMDSDDPAASALVPRPTREQAEAAVRTLIRWIGEDPTREGLLDTPRRVVKAQAEQFGGYAHNPVELLARTFTETDGYDEMVLLRGVRFASRCEHHMLPIDGIAHIAYLPDRRVVGVSKLARVLEVFARRLQIQERLTAQIADTIQEVLRPRGVAVVIEAQHGCMAARGVRKHGVAMVTSRLLGSFQSDAEVRRQFLAQVRGTARRGAASPR